MQSTRELQGKVGFDGAGLAICGEGLEGGEEGFNGFRFGALKQSTGRARCRGSLVTLLDRRRWSIKHGGVPRRGGSARFGGHETGVRVERAKRCEHRRHVGSERAVMSGRASAADVVSRIIIHTCVSRLPRCLFTGTCCVYRIHHEQQHPRERARAV